MLFAHGSLFGGHALYVKDNRLHYVYNFVGMHEQKIVATEDVPTGEKLILSASFDKSGEDPPGVATGLLSLWHGDTKVGEARIKTQPGKFMIAGEGLCIGRDGGAGVTADYPGEQPWRFTGGTITAGRRRRQRRGVHRPRARGRGDADARVAGQRSHGNNSTEQRRPAVTWKSRCDTPQSGRYRTMVERVSEPWLG